MNPRPSRVKAAFIVTGWAVLFGVVLKAAWHQSPSMAALTGGVWVGLLVWCLWAWLPVQRLEAMRAERDYRHRVAHGTVTVDDLAYCLRKRGIDWSHPISEALFKAVERSSLAPDGERRYDVATLVFCLEVGARSNDLLTGVQANLSETELIAHFTGANVMDWDAVECMAALRTKG